MIGKMADAMTDRLPVRVLCDVKRDIGRKEFDQQAQDEKPRTQFDIVKVPETVEQVVARNAQQVVTTVEVVQTQVNKPSK